MDKTPSQRPGWRARMRARRWQQDARLHTPEMLQALCRELLERRADPRALAVPLATPDAPAAILADLLRARALDCGLAQRRAAHRELIQAAYREILKRPAEAEEAAEHDAFFQEHGALIGVPHLITALLDQGGFTERASSRTAATDATPPYREIVAALYRSLLARPADRGGLDTNENYLREKGLEKGLPALVSSMLGCAEFRERAAHHVLYLLEPAKAQLVNGRKIAHIVSLGTHCLASFLMKQHQFKRYSLPFDWLFASPQSVLHCLQDDFKEFLDPKHYVSLPVDPKRPDRRDPGAEHLFYREHHEVNAMFNHRDPTRSEDHLYFQRAVNRFRRVLASPDGKLFLMIARPQYDAVEAFPALSAQLRATTANSAFVCVQMRTPTRQPGCHAMRRLQANGGDHVLYEFTSSSLENGLGFDESLDDLAILRLVRQYDIDLAPEPEETTALSGAKSPAAAAPPGEANGSKHANADDDAAALPARPPGQPASSGARRFGP